MPLIQLYNLEGAPMETWDTANGPIPSGRWDSPTGGYTSANGGWGLAPGTYGGVTTTGVFIS